MTCNQNASESEVIRLGLRTTQLFSARFEAHQQRTDRIFRVLLIVEWIAGILAAVWLTPETWDGDASRTHLHVWSAIVLGGLITCFPVFLSYRCPGETVTRHIIAASQVLWSALLIHLTGGRIETHFHVFGSLAFIAFYRDWRVLLSATLVVAFDHAFRGVYFPRSIYGLLTGGEWRFLEHAGWVVFCDFFLLISIRHGIREMWMVAGNYTELEKQHVDASKEVRLKSESLRTTRESLELNRQRLEMAIRGTSDGLWDWNIETDEVWYSPRFLELLGYCEDEIEFKFDEWVRRLHPDDKSDTLAAVKRHLEEDDPFDVQYRLKTKSGDWKWFRARGACVRNEEGWPVRMAGALQDISDHRLQSDQLAEQDAKLQQKQKLEAVGSLAGGVAHEFNNLLQAIQGYMRFAQEGLDESEQRYQDLVQALKAADRAATLTSQLLCFSRADHYEAQPVEPDMLLDDLSKLLKPVIGERISVAITTKPDTPAVLADPAGLQQVLLNLCVNARDAMPDGGQLVVKAEAANLSDGYCKLHGVDRPGKYVRFTVSDTGTGMSPEQAERIFEPFFTTKEVGKGTGLGLAMVHGFVERHKGLINVYSEPGEGTTFRVYIPLADECSMITPSDEPQVTTGGDELLLVAEDEPMVRAVAERILKNAGYRVLTAVDGREAVKLFVEHQDQISLTLLDVVMPNLTGRQAYEAIREIDADARAIFCTGYDPETSQAASFQQDSLMLVQKPYDPDELLRAVRQLIDEHTQSETVSCTH
tara:strand:- start:7735 stop:10014 length:2280 start_codon:yes stop_codon:yes gene_type:complete